MEKRNLLVLFALSIVTLGLYMIYWFVKTKGELVSRGAQIPTAWLLIVPIVSWWWMYKYYEGAEHVTNGKSGAIINFILGFFITPLLPMMLLQNEYNKMGSAAAAGGNPWAAGGQEGQPAPAPQQDMSPQIAPTPAPAPVTPQPTMQPQAPVAPAPQNPAQPGGDQQPPANPPMVQ